MNNSPYYIAPVGDRTHDLPHTVSSNMVKVSHALTTRPRSFYKVLNYFWKYSAQVWSSTMTTLYLHSDECNNMKLDKAKSGMQEQSLSVSAD